MDKNSPEMQPIDIALDRMNNTLDESFNRREEIIKSLMSQVTSIKIDTDRDSSKMVEAKTAAILALNTLIESQEKNAITKPKMQMLKKTTDANANAADIVTELLSRINPKYSAPATNSELSADQADTDISKMADKFEINDTEMEITN